MGIIQFAKSMSLEDNRKRAGKVIEKTTQHSKLTEIVINERKKNTNENVITNVGVEVICSRNGLDLLIFLRRSRFRGAGPLAGGGGGGEPRPSRHLHCVCTHGVWPRYSRSPGGVERGGCTIVVVVIVAVVVVTVSSSSSSGHDREVSRHYCKGRRNTSPSSRCGSCRKRNRYRSKTWWFRRRTPGYAARYACAR